MSGKALLFATHASETSTPAFFLALLLDQKRAKSGQIDEPNPRYAVPGNGASARKPRHVIRREGDNSRGIAGPDVGNAGDDNFAG